MKARIFKRCILSRGRGRAVMALGWLALLAPQAICAESLHPWFDRKVAVFIGAVDFNVDATIAKWNDGEDIDYINLARLGVPESDTDLWMRLSARLGERWQISMDYFTLGVAGGREVNFDFTFGDLIVPVGASVDASLDVDFYVLSMSYAFYRSERLEFGAGVGVHGVDLAYDMFAEARAGSLVSALGEDDDEFLAPLPNAALYTSYAFSPRLLGQMQAGWISLSYDEYDGELLALHAQLAYLLTARTSVGLGYTIFNFEVERDRGTRREFYDLDLHGPRVFFSAAF